MTLGRVVIGNERGIRATITPGAGGQIVSLMNADGREYLAQGTRRRIGLPQESPYVDGGLGGIDDCIPAIAPGIYPSEPFHGAKIPDHGDVWMRPWDILSRSQTELALRVRGSSLPYELRRVARVDGDALVTSYSLSNVGHAPFAVVWAAHALIEPGSGCTIELPGVQEVSRELDNLGLPRTVSWPSHDGIGLAAWETFPEGGYAKLFAPMPATAMISVRFDDDREDLRIQTNASWSSFIGIWLNRGGFPEKQPIHHVGIEPTFGSSDALSSSVADASALTLSAGETRRWSIAYRISRSAGTRRARSDTRRAPGTHDGHVLELEFNAAGVDAAGVRTAGVRLDGQSIH